MRFPVCLIAIVLFSCGHTDHKQTTAAQDTTVVKTDTSHLATTPPADTAKIPSSMAMEVNRQLQAKFPNQWTVLTDSIAQWPKDEFDYFIAAKRKLDTDYPYIAKGDFNADGKADWAALVVNPKRDKYRIAIMRDSTRLIIWEEDVQGAAITANPKQDIGSIDGEVAKIKSESINVEFFEKSSWVLYWTGSSFKKIWTGD